HLTTDQKVSGLNPDAVTTTTFRVVFLCLQLNNAQLKSASRHEVVGKVSGLNPDAGRSPQPPLGWFFVL
ncbi:MAG TPA: hypothetical protein PKY29_09625, partial [Ferruginibacter sp.]|nr:hypothetical protein [Ferruginibacter sp.]